MFCRDANGQALSPRRVGAAWRAQADIRGELEIAVCKCVCSPSVIEEYEGYAHVSAAYSCASSASSPTSSTICQIPPEWRADLFRLIASTPELDWLLLTKRPENIEKMLKKANVGMPLPNVWLGFTAEDQENYERRWKIMREIPAAVRFCSYEPAIGPLRIFAAGGETGYPAGLGWLICGGESGKGYRWMEQEWEEAVRHDCARAGIPYFLSSVPEKLPISANFPVVRQFPEMRA